MADRRLGNLARNMYVRLLGNPMALNRELRLRVLKPYLSSLVAGNVLDVGCGDGSFTRCLLINGAHVQAVDVIDWGISRYLPEASFQRADGRRLPYADASFDFVFSSDVLEHVPDCQAIVKEIGRVLRPEGRCLISTVNGYWESPLKLRRFLLRLPPSMCTRLLGRFCQTDADLHLNVLGHVRYDLGPCQVAQWMRESGVTVTRMVFYCRAFGSLLMETYFSFNETLRYGLYPLLLSLLWLDRWVKIGKAWQYAIIGHKAQ